MFELNERNKRALIILVSFLVPFIIIYFIYLPYVENKVILNKKIRTKKKHFEEMLSLEKQFKRYKKSSKTKQISKNIDFSLYTFLYNLSGKSGIKENISYIKPSNFVDKERGVKGTLVEIEFKKVSMNLFTNLLYEIENSGKGLFIKKMSIIKSGSKSGNINIIMHVESIDV